MLTCGSWRWDAKQFTNPPGRLRDIMILEGASQTIECNKHGLCVSIEAVTPFLSGLPREQTKPAWKSRTCSNSWDVARVTRSKFRQRYQGAEDRQFVIGCAGAGVEEKRTIESARRWPAAAKG